MVASVPGKCVSAIGKHVAVIVIGDWNAIPVGQLIGRIVRGRDDRLRQTSPREAASSLDHVAE